MAGSLFVPLGVYATHVLIYNLTTAGKHIYLKSDNNGRSISLVNINTSHNTPGAHEPNHLLTDHHSIM